MLKNAPIRLFSALSLLAVLISPYLSTIAIATPNTAIANQLEHADAYYITQYRHPRYNPNQHSGTNASCGPTSLAMALKAFKVAPTNLMSRGRANALVSSVRKTMTGSSDDTVWTYPAQILTAAQRYGLNGQLVHSLEGITNELKRPGRLVILNINPTPAYSAQLVTPYDGGHFALVYAIRANIAYICDPLATGPLTITLQQLQRALTTPLGVDAFGNTIPPFDGGISLWSN